MAVIRSALHLPDLGECFTYSERLRIVNENVSTGSEVKVFAKTHAK